MQELIIKNVNIEEVFYIISGTDTNKVRVMAENVHKSFKMDSEVNYLDGE